VLVTLTTTHRPATDLGYLLHKHPGRAQVFPVSAGTAQVFYPVATDEECTAALMVDIDPIALVRGNHNKSFALGQYVNDRPYAAGSMLAVAISTVFRSTMNGVSAKQDLAEEPIPLAIHIPALPARGGTDLVASLFTPLGWQVTANQLPLDPAFPDWGDSAYVDLRCARSGR
jgi:3' terminal RNA ribose 2'-O-methyltransferase Hen1